jgi:hypothetical protein
LAERARKKRAGGEKTRRAHRRTQLGVGGFFRALNALRGARRRPATPLSQLKKIRDAAQALQTALKNDNS